MHINGSDNTLTYDSPFWENSVMTLPGGATVGYLNILCFTPAWIHNPYTRTRKLTVKIGRQLKDDSFPERFKCNQA